MEAGIVLNSHRKKLDIKCSREIRDKIAAEIVDVWDLLGRTLEVSDKNLKSIRYDISLALPEKKAVAVLDTWAEELGSGATCLKLAEALHRHKKTRVIELLFKELNFDATTSGPGTHCVAVSPLPPDNQQQQQGHDIIEPDVEVVAKKKKLESRFRSLHKNIMVDLELKKVSVGDLLHSLRFLPSGLRQEYMKPINVMFEDLRREKEVSEIFLYLNPLVSFLDYGLTEYLIDEFGSNTLKKKMNDYSGDVVQFMKETTVKEMLGYWPDTQEIPPNYTMLKVKINEDPKTYTLYDVDQLRKQYCCGKMVDLFCKTNGLKMSNSFIVECLVPSGLVPQWDEYARQLDSSSMVQLPLRRKSQSISDELSNSPLCSGSESDVEFSVVTRVEKLKDRLLSLQRNILSELKAKKIPVQKVLNSLAFLPINLRLEYETILKLPDLWRYDEISDLFCHLNRHVNFIDHGLIKHIIHNFGSNTLKSMMAEYSKDVVQFMKKTTVKQLIDHWPGQREISLSFSELTVRFDKDPTTITLYDLDQKRRYFCSRWRLTEFIHVLIMLEV